MAKAPAKDVKNTKQSTLAGFFGPPKPKSSPRPSSAASRSSQPAPGSSPVTTSLRIPSAVATASPVVAGREIPRPGSPMKKNLQNADFESEDDLTPPPESGPSSAKTGSSSKQQKAASTEMMDVDEEEQELDEGTVPGDGSPIALGRRAKRKVVYVESDSDESSGEEVIKPKATQSKSRKPRKSMKEDSDSDEFVFDEADDLAMIAAADEYEAEPSVSSRSPSASPSASPVATSRKSTKGTFVATKSLPKKAPTWGHSSPAESSTPVRSARPGPKPLANRSLNSDSAGPGASASRGMSSANHSDWLLTAAEKKKIKKDEEKKAKETCFDFMQEENVRDQDGNRPTDPDYDGRTVRVPKKSHDAMTLFEKQFWDIKKNYYDTVLFFQKGKFYELYEEDAMIGYQEFDLKLTDRVKMKMVGVPEQSLEMWISKFVGAGHKVGIVKQMETAIGADMRNKNSAAPKGSKTKQESDMDKIVRRELTQVFTNGTIVDGAYLHSDEANHCVSIKEHTSVETGLSTYGICKVDASTAEIGLTSFEDDIIFTQLETYFRQIRPTELIYAKGNLSPETIRLLRNVLPSSTRWESFREGREFCSAEETLHRLAEMFQTEEDMGKDKPLLLPSIAEKLEDPLAMEALGGMLSYLKSMNLDKDLVSQKNFNIYDPIREGKSLVLDGQTLKHMEVFVNGDGGKEGTLLELLQRTQTPFGVRLFKVWLQAPLRDAKLINDRLDAVDDLMDHPDFVVEFNGLAKGMPDLERLISRIHAGSLPQKKFLEVVKAFTDIRDKFPKLVDRADHFDSESVKDLLRRAPDLTPYLKRVKSSYKVDHNPDKNTFEILPEEGADPQCDEADVAVRDIEKQLDRVLAAAQKEVRAPSATFWSSAQGGKEIFQIQVPATTKVPRDWTKASGTKAVSRYYTPETIPLIRKLQEARETQNTVKGNFYNTLLRIFDESRPQWLQTIKTIAELDCLVSLAKASSDMDQPKCRPTFVDPSSESDGAFIDFEQLRHPSMCLRSDFIANDVQLGHAHPRQILLTGPNMAGKSTLLRMTAAGVILAQMGCYVPAEKARLGAVDRIQTRMGAYDNMFASASTFKVELDECSRILREAGPRSLVILDELGRGTSTYDGMAIAGAVLHHLATHTLPLGFFATHYGSLTDDFGYHPNIRNMHMQTHVDDEQRQVVFLYKLIPGVAESSHGTHVARMAGVPKEVVQRAESVSLQFLENFNEKLASRRKSKLPLVAQADFAWLMRMAGAIDPLPQRQRESTSTDTAPVGGQGDDGSEGINKDGKGQVVTVGKSKAGLKEQMEIILRAVGRYEISN